jgi:hypothetical protein
MTRRILAPLGGIVAWLGAVVVCQQVNDPRLTTVLMPLWRPVLALAGQGPNIGTPARPAYEATPVHAILGWAGIALSALVYIAVVWGWAAWRARQSSRAAHARPT